MSDVTDKKVLVWDLPVRIGHWALVACFATAWLTGVSDHADEWQIVHVRAGAAMLAIVFFRLLWGVIGSRYATFKDFVRGPGAVLGYLKSLLRRQPQHFAGHNPAGGWSILALLALIVLAAGSGWLKYQAGVDSMEKVHTVTVYLLLAVVVIHLGGVVVSSWLHRENLVRAMLTGKKPAGDADQSINGLRWVAAFMLVIWAAAAAWLLTL